MKHNAIIITAGNVENYDNDMWFKTYSVKPDDMTPEVFEQMVLERGYELAEEAATTTTSSTAKTSSRVTPSTKAACT